MTDVTAYVDTPIEEIIRRFRFDPTLGTDLMDGPYDRLGVEVVAVFDHDYMGCHLLVQVCDKSARPNPWSYHLYHWDTSGVTLVRDYGDKLWAAGHVPLISAAALVSCWRRYGHYAYETVGDDG